MSPEEAEKQYKREQLVRKAIKHVLTKVPEGFALDDLPKQLEAVNVKGFNPKTCGYPTLEKFVKRQPDRVLKYNKAKQWVLPAKQ